MRSAYLRITGVSEHILGHLTCCATPLHVQDLIKADENLKMLKNNRDLMIYVCGRSKDMPTDVENAFKYHGIDVERMRSEGRYFEETWG